MFFNITSEGKTLCANFTLVTHKYTQPENLITLLNRLGWLKPGMKIR